MLERIRELGIMDDTLLMLTTDHGEPFGEHGYIRKARPYNHEQLVHIPWIIRHPHGLGAGKAMEGLVQTTDMMPTILDALAIDTPLVHRFLAPTRTMFPQDMVVDQRTVTMHGRSLLPMLRGEVDQVRSHAYSGHHGRQWSVRDQEWAFLLNIDGSGGPELYHRLDDPEEQINLIDQHPEVAQALELNLRRWVASLE